MKSWSDVATAIAGVTAGTAVLALLWAVLGMFFGVAYRAFLWAAGL